MSRYFCKSFMNELWYLPQIEVKRAYMQQRNSQTSAPPSVEKTKKVFVGGLDAATNKEDIEEAFIGTGCNSVQLMTEKGTERPRGFAFIYFDSVESAGKVCEQKWFKVKVSVVRRRYRCFDFTRPMRVRILLYELGFILCVCVVAIGTRCGVQVGPVEGGNGNGER